MLTTPIFDVIKSFVPVVGWGIVCTAFIWGLKIAWSVRGSIDSFLNKQDANSEKTTKAIIDRLGQAEKTAIAQVESAKNHGAQEAAEIKSQAAGIASNVEKLDVNHLAHIEAGVTGLNAKTDRLIDKTAKHLELAADMKESLAILVDRSGSRKRSR
jgi:uncharacterized phage infection (PIP) family protein YhgE